MTRPVLLVVVCLLLAAPADARVNGISDDNLPLMTKRGRAAIERVPFRHARMVVSMGTPANDPQVRAWMREVRGHPWTTMIAARRVKGQPVPTARAYADWLRGLLRAYPQISAVEATNEPELTRLSAPQAATLYRAAVRAARGRKVRVLAGGFSDAWAGQERYRRYVRSYARRVRAETWAQHAYIAPMRGALREIRWTVRATRARRVWITETAAFVAHGEQRFTRAQQLAQARLIVRLSEWPEVTRTFWQGWEACHGCQPAVTAHVKPAPHVVAPGPVLPYPVASSPIVWDSYLLSSDPSGTDVRPSGDAVFGPDQQAVSGRSGGA